MEGLLGPAVPQALGEFFGSAVVFWPCHTVSPTARPAQGTSAWIRPWITSKGRRGCLLGFYSLSPLCGLPANIISLALASSPPLTPSPVTVVCYQADRDELRRRVIQWLEAEIIPDGWFSKGSNYSEVLDKYFKASRASSGAGQRFLASRAPGEEAARHGDAAMGARRGWCAPQHGVVWAG